MFTRRALLKCGAVASVATVSGCFTRQTQWEFLSEAEARTLAALCDQIIPADDFPSASQAGVLHFIDRQLVRHYEQYRRAYRDGLRRVDKACRAKYSAELASLLPEQQLAIAVATEHDQPEFFELVRRHTMQGYYGSPRHGGNRAAVSWRMLGLDEPPLRGRAQYDFTARPQA